MLVSKKGLEKLKPLAQESDNVWNGGKSVIDPSRPGRVFAFWPDDLKSWNGQYWLGNELETMPSGDIVLGSDFSIEPVYVMVDEENAANWDDGSFVGDSEVVGYIVA